MRGPEPTETRSSMLRSEQDRDNRQGISAGVEWRGFFARRYRKVEVKEQFTQAWLALALILTALGLIVRVDVLLLIAGALLILAGISWLWNWAAFLGLHFRREFSVERAFVGETVTMRLVVSNRKFLPLSWLQVRDRVSTALPIDEVNLPATGRATAEMRTFWSLKWYEEAGKSFHVQAVQRGFYEYGPARLETGDLFGLFRSVKIIEEPQTLIVYPRLVPVVHLGLPAKEPFGDRRAPRFTFEDPIRTVGVRDYRPEDDFRRVHWKASARRQTLQTRVLEPASSHNLVVFLNAATLEQHWRGVLLEVMEQAISIAGSICYYSLERRWPTGLVVNAALPHSDQSIKVMPGRSPTQITTIMEMLAAVTPFVTAPIEQLIASESPKLPWGSTLVIVTPLVTDALAATLLELKRLGRRLALITLDPEPLPAPLSDILTYRVPRGEMTALDLSHPIAGQRDLLDPAQLQQQIMRERKGAQSAQSAHREHREVKIEVE